MGMRDAEEMLEAAKADAVVLERERDTARARAAALEHQLEALLVSGTTVGDAWAEHRKVWAGPLDDRIRFGAGYGAGYRAAHERETTPVRVVVPEHLRLDPRTVIAPQASELTVLEHPGAHLTPDEVDVVAPALLEAGTRHLERPGTAWHALGHQLHGIAERLYATTTDRQEQHP